MTTAGASTTRTTSSNSKYVLVVKWFSHATKNATDVGTRFHDYVIVKTDLLRCLARVVAWNRLKTMEALGKQTQTMDNEG